MGSGDHTATTGQLRPYAFAPGNKVRRPGQSSRASSSPNLGRYVRKKYGSRGEELVEFLDKVYRGEVTELSNGMPPTLDQRVDAVKELMNRGWGKPGQTVSMQGADGEPLSVSIVINQSAEPEPLYLERAESPAFEEGE